MRTFLLLVRAGFRRHSTYRLALLAGTATNSVFGVIRASVLLGAIGSAGTHIAGYDGPRVLAFVWWGQALLGVVNLWGFQEVGQRVRTGDIAVDFLRPAGPQLVYLAEDIGRAGVNFLARGLPALLIGALLFDLAWPPGIGSWILGLLSVAVAVVVAFCGSFIVNLSAFWIVEIRGIRLLWMITTGFLCGLYVPVPWFPDWLRTFAEWTPFPSMLQHPLDILSGRVDGAAVWGTLATQLAWAVALVVMAQVVLQSGRRRLEVQGG
ncbi:ABC-2 family transporter protein [Intrasporangium calvum]|uniref:ABC-2 family transporter protein n=1 Tax=Intrasporangium calvum TaxID=53358 RepID=A0ABT5GDT6_9MICO|nr:ABC-2 family transporter protein [Intrasporangium calvum]MDC5696397.1 ABC-2 family transporter protein [Intrasporangium calvum]